MKALEHDRWERFFDAVSRGLTGRHVGVEVAGEDVGDQLSIQAATLSGLSYDPHGDAFDVVTPQIDHRVVHPREIWIDDDEAGLRQVIVVDAEGRRQFVKLDPPIAPH